MNRRVAILLTALLVAAVLLDPYTFHETASDAVVAAPWWQTTLGVADAVLLALTGVLVWRRVATIAYRVLAFEVLFALALAIGFVVRDGISRFERGFGGEEFVSYYLCTVMLRVLLLLLTQRLPRSAAQELNMD